MDKDIAVLIMHALIKQLGMHRAGKTDNERRVREAVRERWRKKKGGTENERLSDRKCKTEQRVREGGGSEYVSVGFPHTMIHGQ